MRDATHPTPDHFNGPESSDTKAIFEIKMSATKGHIAAVVVNYVFFIFQDTLRKSVVLEDASEKPNPKVRYVLSEDDRIN